MTSNPSAPVFFLLKALMPEKKRKFWKSRPIIQTLKRRRTVLLNEKNLISTSFSISAQQQKIWQNCFKNQCAWMFEVP